MIRSTKFVGVVRLNLTTAVEDRERLITEATRLLKLGGRLFLRMQTDGKEHACSNEFQGSPRKRELLATSGSIANAIDSKLRDVETGLRCVDRERDILEKGFEHCRP